MEKRRRSAFWPGVSSYRPWKRRTVRWGHSNGGDRKITVLRRPLSYGLSANGNPLVDSGEKRYGKKAVCLRGRVHGKRFEVVSPYTVQEIRRRRVFVRGTQRRTTLPIDASRGVRIFRIDRDETVFGCVYTYVRPNRATGSLGTTRFRGETKKTLPTPDVPAESGRRLIVCVPNGTSVRDVAVGIRMGISIRFGRARRELPEPTNPDGQDCNAIR